MAHGGGPSSGGGRKQNKGKRAHGTDPNIKKQNNRGQDSRILAARTEVAEAEAKLAGLIAEGGIESELTGTCTRCGERPPRGASVWCGPCQTEVAEMHGAPSLGMFVPAPVPPNPNNLKLRPCAKNGREEKHPGHEWEAGGTGVERWCVGFPVPGSYAEGLTAEKLKGRSAVVIPEGHELTISVLPEDDAGDGKWPMAYTTARMMLKQGYNIKHVTKFTGIKADELRDIPVDDEGYGIRKEDTDA